MKKHPKKKYGKCKCGKTDKLYYWKDGYYCRDCLNEDEIKPTIECNAATNKGGFTNWRMEL